MDLPIEAVLPKATRMPNRKKKSSASKKKGGCTFQTDYHHSRGDIRCKRLKWSKDLHTSFLNAIAKLGVKAVPSAILNEMNVIGLTRENVASHLQKFRLQLNSGKITLEEIISSPPPSNPPRSLSVFPQEGTTVYYPVINHPIEVTINENSGFFSEFQPTQSIPPNAYVLETYEQDYGFWNTAPTFHRPIVHQFAPVAEAAQPYEANEYYPSSSGHYSYVTSAETAHSHCTCPGCQPLSLIHI
eukprot:TRINITY_DN9466_c0_g1_i1.p1 TRINITY_DN9466_c0_g1~~TRINITY_DN9466_c0_g1_i1.p1  ORF type:complete len:243 (+),score=37.44 TRINITY_DN9466_c0_g1_i1:302-1030(+)